MLSPNYLDSISDDIVNIYNQLEFDIIEEISSRIASVGYANTVVFNNAVILQEMGMTYQDTVRLVAKHNNASEGVIKKIFKDAGVKTLKYDDSVYKLAGLNPLPLNQSKRMLDFLLAGAVKTNRNLRNLTMTTAVNSQQAFYTALNKAYMEVASGSKSYSQAILDGVKGVAEKSTVVTYPSGRKIGIEAAVRMNVVTGVNQTSSKLQEMRADELGWDLMEISAHGGARPEHAIWQGKVVSRSGRKGYLSLNDIGYGDVTGFQGVNCRHGWFPFYEGSTKTHNDEELQEMQNETVLYNGQQISRYEANQLQRQMERQIRNDRKELAGLQGTLKGATDNKLIEDTKTAFAQKTLHHNTRKQELDTLIKQTRNKKDDTRLMTPMYNKTVGTEVAQVTRLANRYNKSDIVGTVVNGTKVSKIGEHIISRTHARGVGFESVQKALKNPLDYGKIRKDRTQTIVGEKVTVSINVDTGRLTTVYPTSSKKAEKLKGLKNNANS